VADPVGTLAKRPLDRSLARVVDARPGEGAGAIWSFASFFTLLAGYYVLRALREEMGIRGGVDNLPWNFTATFGLMLVALPLYSRLVARLPRARAVPLVYRFFLVTLVAFWALFRAGAWPGWLPRAFFVWVSVYGLFVVSVFWSLLVDLFTTDQGKRLFGFVAAGGSDEGRLHAGGAGPGDGDGEGVRRLEGEAKLGLHLVHDPEELGIEVAEQRGGHGAVDARVNGAGTGAEEQADGGRQLSDGGGGDEHGPA